MLHYSCEELYITHSISHRAKLKGGDKQAWTVLHHGGVTDKASTAYLLVIPECKASIAFATNYIPNKFWRMRPKMAEILKSYINITECKKANKSLKRTNNS